MIVNEIAKLENPLQPRRQLLLVAELGEASARRRSKARSCSSATPSKKRFGIRPSLVTYARSRMDVKASGANLQRARLCDRTGGSSARGRRRDVSRPRLRRQPPGSRPARMCSVPSHVLAHHARGARRVALAHRAQQPAVLLVGGRAAPPAGARCRRSGRSSRPAPRSSPAPAARERVASASPTCRRTSAWR